NRIIQNALVIGGTSTSHGTVTIDASDASGNPLIGVPATQLGEPGPNSSNFAAFPAPVNFDSVAGSGPNSASLPLGSAVPEPPTLLLLAIVGLAVISRRRILR
ncbi:MAG TPA: PEP-CTERM sorting domain-containing protein, partial [Pirellulales bacterium]